MPEPDITRRLRRDNTFSYRTESVLREMILDGTMLPGQRLNEVALASSLGISRGPLREAIQRLTGEGLLTAVSHRGAHVRAFERSEVIELYELRAALELHAVRLVIERASDDDLCDLESMLSETQHQMALTGKREYPQQLDFHLQLVRLGGNQALTRAALEAHRLIALARSMSAHVPMRARAAVVEHTDLVASLRDRDADRALMIMSEHLAHSMQSALAILNLPGEEED